jgi:hypothetical protein
MEWDPVNRTRPCLASSRHGPWPQLYSTYQRPGESSLHERTNGTLTRFRDRGLPEVREPSKTIPFLEIKPNFLNTIAHSESTTVQYRVD